MRASLYTLGCRLNQSETAIIEKYLTEKGFTIVPFKSPCDLAIINTCTVTSKADSSCRQIIRSYIRRNPNAYIAVIGCYSQISYQELAKIKGIDLILGNQEKLNVMNYVSLGKNKTPIIIRDKIMKEDFSIEYIGQAKNKARAHLKIQDGCNFMCSFCIIPMARGRARSRNFDNCLQEAQVLAKKGFKEIVLTGVNIGTFGENQDDIVRLIDKIEKIDGIQRIRISSIEPTTISKKLFPLMADKQHKLVPFLHIPLQSASNKILKAMKRKYTIEEYNDFIFEAKSSIPNLCLGSDILTGMPTETEENFMETYNYLKSSELNYFHIFSYSERAGTQSIKIFPKTPSKVIRNRSSMLRHLSERKKQAFYQKFLGEKIPVLFESYNNKINSGYTENYIRVSLPSEKNFSKQIKTVTLEKNIYDSVVAKPI